MLGGIFSISYFCFHLSTAQISADLDDDKMHERMKAITRIQNIPQANIGGAAKKLVTTYNGTPFLTRPQHKFYRGHNYFEARALVAINIIYSRIS